jgi:hypothetical protein
MSSCWGIIGKGPVEGFLCGTLLSVDARRAFGERLIVFNCSVLSFWNGNKLPSCIEPSVRYNTTQKDEDKHTCLMPDSHRESQRPIDQGLTFRPLGNWDRHLNFRNSVNKNRILNLLNETDYCKKLILNYFDLLSSHSENEVRDMKRLIHCVPP